MKQIYQIIFLLGIITICACSNSNKSRSIEDLFAEQYPNAQLCSVEKTNGLHSKEDLLSFIESYDETYDEAFNKIAIPSEVKKILRSEKERALDFVRKSSFKEYDSYVVNYLTNSSEDTLWVNVLCNKNTRNAVILYQPEKYEDGKIVEDEAFKKWEATQNDYNETYAAVYRYADFATLVKMLMEEENGLLYTINMKQIQDFIIKYY